MIIDDVIFENRELFSIRTEIISTGLSIDSGETTVTITDGEKCSCLCARNLDTIIIYTVCCRGHHWLHARSSIC